MATNKKPFDSYEFGRALADIASAYLTVFDAHSDELRSCINTSTSICVPHMSCQGSPKTSMT